MIQHGYSDCASKTFKWLDPDSKESYDKHCKSDRHRNMLELFGWIGTDIEYQFNSHGYRAAEFDQRENFVTLGCSFTFGLGVNAHESWPEVLSKLLGLSVWNLGVPGTSTDTCYRIAKHYIPALKPKFVVMLEPRRNRLELLDSTHPLPHIVNFAHGFQAKWDDGLYVKKWVTDQDNMEIHAEKNRAAIAYVCQQYNIPIVMLEPDAYITMVDQKQRDLGRDLLHAGRLNNQAFAEAIAEKVKQYA